MEVATRNTRQRETVIETIRAAEGPLTASRILDRAGRQLPGLGLATVYRTLGWLLTQGAVLRVDLPGAERYYEAAGKGRHDHFVCSRCELVFCLGALPLGIPRGTTLPGGFEVDYHRLVLVGLCPECALEEEQESADLAKGDSSWRMQVRA